ncbi:MAG TPA: hypothetical protein VIS06_00030, partial [Mycobacteriales bacterium]
PAPAAPHHYGDPALDAIRALYITGTRPGTEQMRDAVQAATGTRPSGTTCRQKYRPAIEAVEPHLAQLPAAPITLRTA